MDLREWKQRTEDSIKEYAKDSIREGYEVRSTIFDTDMLEDEILLEDTVEIVEDFEEIELVDFDDLTENFESPQEIVEFVPEEFADEMDIEAEIDLNEVVMNVVSLGKIRDLLYAEDYEVSIDEAANRAKVVFKRSQGEIQKKKKCGPGMKLSGNRCIPQTGTQKAKEKIKGIKLKRAKKAMGQGKKKKAALRGKITKRRVKGRARNYSGIE